MQRSTAALGQNLDAHSLDSYDCSAVTTLWNSLSSHVKDSKERLFIDTHTIRKFVTTLWNSLSSHVKDSKERLFIVTQTHNPQISG